MSSLAGKKILLGVTGGIAAYKAGELIRRLKDQQAEVRVVTTVAAEAFVKTLTFQALSGSPVHSDLLDPQAEAGMGHIELARWADLVLIAPTSADFMAKLAAGLASDLLSTLCLATTAPIFLAPAMNQQMWKSAATRRNCEQLESLGYLLLGPASGDQACGDVGPGRMLEPHELIGKLLEEDTTGRLGGRHLLITAGPTREAIDPVRYISNYSSGKMGFAIARAAARAGARVTLVCGPTDLNTPKGVQRIDVESCDQMLEAVLQALPADIFVGTAAVADYRPAQISPDKLKKQSESLVIELVRNPDILATVASSTPRPDLVVGFAAESESLETYGRSKLRNKKLDLVVANLVNQEGGVFGSDENQAMLIDEKSLREFPRLSKDSLADILVEEFSNRL